MRGGLDAQRFEIVEESLFKLRGESVERHTGLAAAADCFIVDVGEVHDAVDLEAAGFEVALEKVFENIGAEIADVGMIIDRGAAGVHGDGPGIERRKFFEFARISIKKLHWENSPNSAGAW
jgi:hypothetical protein